MSSVDPTRMTNAKGTKRSGSSTGGKGGKKGKTKEEYNRVADNLSAQHGAPPSPTVHPAASAAMPQGLPHHLPILGVGAEVTSPATWSERGLPSLRGGRGDPHGYPRFRTLNFSCGQCFKEVLC